MKNLREINEKMSQMEAILKTREFNETEKSEYAALEREFAQAKRENEMQNIEANQREQKPMLKTIQQQIREAISGNKKEIQMRAVTTAANSGAAVVGEEIQGILEPLYADSVLAKAGVRFYPGCPMGDVTIPVLGKGSVAWASETGAAQDAAHAFSGVTLTPKRLTAYTDISFALLNQDKKGANEAIMNDLYKAIADKLEATILGTAAGSGTQPAGMLNGVTPTDATTFAKLVALEGTLDAANVGANRKYIVSAGAKADLRGVAKAGNAGLVYQNNEIDGTPALMSGNVGTNGTFIYGDWSNLAIASWDDIKVTVDPYTQAGNGCVRLIVNAYFDCKPLRSNVFAIGRTRTIG